MFFLECVIINDLLNCFKTFLFQFYCQRIKRIENRSEFNVNILQRSLSIKEPSHRIIKYLAIQLSNQVLKYFWEQNDPNSI